MTDDKPPFALSSADLNSATWQRLAEHLTYRLALLRKQNDGQLDEIQTAKLRGQISIFKELLLLEKPTPPIDG